MRSLLVVFLSIFFIIPQPSQADEGMWLPMLIKRLNIDDMQKKGLQLSAEEIYSVNNASIKDAIISFNGYCTGEIISPNGLLLTNHHCGYDAIQNHSSVENDYLGNGFWAKSYEDEIPNEGLFVDFLIRMDDVSSEVLDSISFDTEESTRKKLIQSRIEKIKSRETKDTNYWAEIKPFYGGSEFYLFIYERFNDVRLVGTPPESIGKFGGETDNWMWPRHTGDFALFRVYTDLEGNPAEFNKNNIPMKPKHHLPISLDGVKESDFAMILGYPGGTDRYLSSFGVKLAVDLYNPTVVKVREAKLDILNDYMRSDRNISIMYASKKARISNYWKYYIGQTKGLKRLRVYDRKTSIESAFSQFVNSSNLNKKIYGDVLINMDRAYNEIEKMTLSRIYLNEAAWGGPSFIRLARRSEGLLKSLEGGSDSLINASKKSFMSEVTSSFKEYKKEIDQDIFVKMMQMYFENVPKDQLPKIILDMEAKYQGNFEKWGSMLYEKSIFVDEQKLINFLKNPTAKKIKKDPGYIVQKSILDNYFNKILPAISSPRESLAVSNRLFIDGLRKMSPKKVFYPDANFTMRLTFGSVGEYSPGNAMMYDYVTTLDGVMEKLDNSDPEFIVPDRLVELYNSKDYGVYANEEGEINVCFISNNDITGGNSGSPVINGKGELIGCAFDGNWEAMSGDIAFEENLQRTISVDVRYILFIIDKFANASHIIDELTLVKMSDEEKNTAEKKETERFISDIRNLIEEFPEIIDGVAPSLKKSAEMSFSDAFLEARKSGQKTFVWKGETYNTELQVGAAN
ncbi:MAG: S46 family peptidase [Flavobacteriales bacterium TMED191]|nr:MAG: S46 family peptidase [Flavobacteriales bacterium TMED191]|tara:strand:- start:2069 stop:4459 length:2391 start_codon:yes stop_codon:yes gene_type:complete